MVHVKAAKATSCGFSSPTARPLQRKALDIENEIRGTLKSFGLKVGKVSRRRFEARVLELAADRAALGLMVTPMLNARAALIEEFNRLHRMVLNAVRDDPCAGAS
jgi:transposase